MSKKKNVVRVKRGRFSVGKLREISSDVVYWRSRPAAERWQAVELMRQINYGKAATSGRLKRVLEVAKLKTR